MNAKKNLCAMIPADLHAKVIAEKEQLALSTLGYGGGHQTVYGPGV